MTFSVWAKARTGSEKGKWVIILCFDELELTRNVAKEYVYRVLDKVLLIKDNDDGTIQKLI